MLRHLFAVGADYKYLGGFILMKKISNEWTPGRSLSQASFDYFLGPYIEYGLAPKQFVKYRVIRENNAYYIDRYVDTSEKNYKNDNISYQILYRNTEPHKYLIYGIDFEDHVSDVVNSKPVDQ
jgi:hypothetical protein